MLIELTSSLDNSKVAINKDLVVSVSEVINTSKHVERDGILKRIHTRVTYRRSSTFKPYNSLDTYVLDTTTINVVESYKDTMKLIHNTAIHI